MGENDTEDWYKFQAIKGQVIYVNVRPPKDVDVNLYLWDSLGNSRTSSTYGVSSAEYVQYVCDVSGEWRIRLVLASGSGWYRFNLTVQNQNDASSGWDAGNIYDEAAYIETGHIYNGYLLSGDSDDWFKFYVPLWKIIEINLTLPIGQSVTLSLYDALGNARASSYYTGIADEHLVCIGNIEGNWSLNIHPISWQANYTFSIFLTNQNDAGSGGDAGNEFEGALQISNGLYAGQLLDADIRDFYQINCDGGKWLNILLKLTFPLECDLELYDDLGYLIASSTYGERIDEYISYYVNTSEKFYVLVELKSYYGFYSLNITQSDRSWQKNAEESGDAGNTFQAATIIGEGYYSGVLSNSDDQDWYRFSVSSSQIIIVGISTDVRLYAPDGSQKAYTYGYATLLYVADSSGDWRIQIYGNGVYAFTLNVRNQNDAEIGQDAGNTFAMASSITDGCKIGYLYPADSDDWFKFNVLSGQVIILGVSIPYYSSAYIYAPDGTQKTYANGYTFVISYIADVSGNWRIRISGYGTYLFTLNIKEQNDAEIRWDAGNTFAMASPITEGYWIAYLEAADTEDWFKFNVQSGQTIVLGISMNYGSAYIYAPDGTEKVYSPGWGFTISCVVDSSGDWRIRISSHGVYTFILTIQLLSEDLVPPTTVASYNGLWHNKDFTIYLSASDDLSGVAETFYRINNGPTQNVSFHGHPLITTEDDNNTLEYWSVDNSGKEELPHKILTGIKLDKTKPIIEIPSRTPSGDVQPLQPVKVSVNVTDNLSGLRNVTLIYSFDNGTTWEPLAPMTLNSTTNLYEATIPGREAGTVVRFKIVAYDDAGNDATRDGTESYCVYEVIPEFPLSILLMLMTILAILLVLVKKSFKKRSATSLRQ
ncbi:MAG: hypothetical protein QXK47_04275 [Candidatus Bathyarchaeia archaeon]